MYDFLQRYGTLYSFLHTKQHNANDNAAQFAKEQIIQTKASWASYFIRIQTPQILMIRSKSNTAHLTWAHAHCIVS